MSPEAVTVAVDWSGRKTGADKVIAVAEVRGGQLTRVVDGLSREQVITDLISLKETGVDLVVGFDFSFSLPSWFVQEQGLSSAPQLWDLASREGERWLAECEPPFWGRKGTRKPDHDGLRATEHEVIDRLGIRPGSGFQTSGAGSVGAGTLRGMPFLTELRDQGFSIWPWDKAASPLVVEVWTRIAVGKTVKSRPDARLEMLTEFGSSIPDGLRQEAGRTEDRFDAVVTALWMDSSRPELLGLPASRDPLVVSEGWTWTGHTEALPMDNLTP